MIAVTSQKKKQLQLLFQLKLSQGPLNTFLIFLSPGCSTQEQERLVEVAHAKLAEFVNSRMQQYFAHVDERIKTEVCKCQITADKLPQI